MNMENCLIVNGEKIEITEEDAKSLKSQIKTSGKLSDLNVSSAFYIGKHEFVVLEHFEDGKTIVILKDLLFEEKQFGENNNYDGSIADDLCNDFGSEIEKIVGGDALCEFTLDLTADDGLKCYGSVKRKWHFRRRICAENTLISLMNTKSKNGGGLQRHTAHRNTEIKVGQNAFRPAVMSTATIATTILAFARFVS